MHVIGCLKPWLVINSLPNDLLVLGSPSRLIDVGCDTLVVRLIFANAYCGQKFILKVASELMSIFKYVHVMLSAMGFLISCDGMPPLQTPRNVTFTRVILP